MPTPAPAPRAPAASPTDALSRVEEKLDRLERRLAFLDQLPAVLEAGASTADDLARTHQLHERMEKALHLVEKLTRPEMLAKLEELVELANTIPDQLSAMMATLDDVAAAALERGVDVATVVPDLTDTAATIVRAIQHARTNLDEPGIFAVLGALRDPDVSRAFGFGLAFARTLGRDLQSQKSALPAGSANA